MFTKRERRKKSEQKLGRKSLFIPRMIEHYSDNHGFLDIKYISRETAGMLTRAGYPGGAKGYIERVDHNCGDFSSVELIYEDDGREPATCYDGVSFLYNMLDVLVEIRQVVCADYPMLTYRLVSVSSGAVLYDAEKEELFDYLGDCYVAAIEVYCGYLRQIG